MEMSKEDQDEWDRIFADPIIPVKAGDEIECDRARLTETAVLVRCNGVWIELRPEGETNERSKAEIDEKAK